MNNYNTIHQSIHQGTNMALHLKNTHISVFLCFLLCKFVASDYTSFGSCLTSYNQTVNNKTRLINDPFRTNLQSLFTNFTTSSLSFYNTSTGQSPDKAYGLYLCRGDVSSDTCQTCINNITNRLIFILDNCKEGVMFMDNCMLHFANYSFFGKADNRVIGAALDKKTALTQEYNQTLVSVLDQVINDAASNSATSFAMYEASVSGADEKVYGLAQCTPDISKGSCSGCLKVALDYLQHEITYVNKTSVLKLGWAMLPSCQLRYDNVSSFDDSSAASMVQPTVSAFLGATWTLFTIYVLLA